MQSVINMDFAKAFGKVPHRRLLYKLYNRVHQQVDYQFMISGYSQQVVLDGEASDPSPSFFPVHPRLGIRGINLRSNQTNLQ